LEKLQKQLEDMKVLDSEKTLEIEELQDTVISLQKENAILQKKAEKFSEAAAEAVTLKEKLILVKQ
jgi:chromosome segregation ATPase